MEDFSIPENDIFISKGVDNVNHKPHPYTIGPKHIKYASDHHSGMLGTETLKAVPCAVRNCQLSYEEHTSNKLLFLSLLRNASKDEVNTFVTDILKPILIENKIDGIAFVDTPEQYRII